MTSFIRGALAKDHSFATGILLALLIWTLTRIVNGITGSGTIEYDIQYARTKLPDGREGIAVSAVLTNLSNEVTFRDVYVTIADTNIEFDTTVRNCAFPAPIWVEGADCTPYRNGLVVFAPWLVPGTVLRFGIKYVDETGTGPRPVVRIRPGGADTKIRLTPPSWETWVVRHEVPVLIGLLLATAVVLAASLAAGIVKDPSPPSPGGNP